MLVALRAGVKFLSDVVLRTGCVETRVHNGVFVSDHDRSNARRGGGLYEQKLLSYAGGPSRPPSSARTNTTHQR